MAVTGQPLPASQDALVAGTRFDATAAVPGKTPAADAGVSCEAGVIRRGRDGTATVELRGANGPVRKVGQPVASDLAQSNSAKRQGDVVKVSFGSDERYEGPDALLAGG